jgi:cytochrome c556
MKNTRIRIWSAAATVLLATISAAAMTATEAIEQRKKEMGGVRDGIVALSAIAKKEQPFKADVVRANAEKITAHLETAATLFPDGSDAGDVETAAKPEIWTDRANFDAILASSHQAAVDLQSVTEESAFPAALGKLGNTCKSCHDLYKAAQQ